MKSWEEFIDGKWNENIDVRDFIVRNYKAYEGNEEFLVGISPKTKALWNKTEKLIQEEVLTGKVKIDTSRFSGINNYSPGYIDKDNEVVVGLQTDEPLKRIVNPYGGYRMVKDSLNAYKVEMEDSLEESFNSYRKTHNQGVFDTYTKEMRTARTVGLLTGLPDAYGRGRIIGDYRRIALYGINFLKIGRAHV